MRNELWTGPNRSFEAFQARARDTACLKCLIKALLVTVAAQKLKVSLTNHNIIRGSVVMKFLVPFLEKVSSGFFNVVAVHDIKDFITYPLPLPTAADCRQSQTDQRPSGRF